MTSRQQWIIPTVLCAIIGTLWAFPDFWYTRHGTAQPVWFTTRTNVRGWTYAETPISEAAERVLVADRTVNGEFRKDGRAVRVFLAKRFEEKPNEIGLFVHTPDRCWVEGGWKIQPSTPDLVEVSAHGVLLAMERRVFDYRGHKELVYFSGLIGGQTLPYRLDHNLSVGQRTALKESQNSAGAAARASDTLFWKRLGNSFASRRALDGPKQFIRISTPVRDDANKADELLQDFLRQWLEKGDYETDRASFKSLAAR